MGILDDVTTPRTMFPIDYAEDEARSRLQRLAQKGSIHDYLKEFSDRDPDVSKSLLSLMALLDGPG